MEQLNYDDMRLLRGLKNSERRIASNKLEGGLERLVKEGYATTSHPNVSETLCSITTKVGRRCTRPRQTTRAFRPAEAAHTRREGADKETASVKALPSFSWL